MYATGETTCSTGSVPDSKREVMIFMKYTRQLSIAIFCYFIAGPFSSATAYDFSAGVFEFQQKMAKKGDAQAQYKLAFMYENGQGTDKDLNKAIGWYKKAAKKRFPSAKMRLTYIDTLENGYKSEKHDPWLAKLKQDAGANDGESLFLLATMHKDGYIVKKDLKRSSSLFKRAIKRDVPGAEAAYEAVQSTLFNQQDRQKAKANAQKASTERAEAERASAEKAKAEKTRAEKEKKSQQHATEQRRAEQQRQQKLAAQRTKRDREREIRQRNEREKARQQQARKAKEQRIAQEKKEAEQARKAKEEEKPLVDKSMCKGKKAKFLTMCR